MNRFGGVIFSRIYTAQLILEYSSDRARAGGRETRSVRGDGDGRETSEGRRRRFTGLP